MTRQEISDEVWAVMEPLMPTVTGRSRPWTDHRLAVEGMAWKFRTGAPWRDVPERFGKWNSIYKRFNRWAEDGTWEKLLAEVQKQADAAGKNAASSLRKGHPVIVIGQERDASFDGDNGLFRVEVGVG